MTIQEIYNEVSALDADGLIKVLNDINLKIELLNNDYDIVADYMNMNNLLLRQSRIKALIDLKETL